MPDGILEVPPKPSKLTQQLSYWPKEQRTVVEVETWARNIHFSAMLRLGLELPSYQLNMYWGSNTSRCQEMKLTIYRKLGAEVKNACSPISTAPSALGTGA